MALAGFLDHMCLALRASGLWLRYAMLQNLIPSFPWPSTLAQSKEKEGIIFCHPATIRKTATKDMSYARFRSWVFRFAAQTERYKKLMQSHPENVGREIGGGRPSAGILLPCHNNIMIELLETSRSGFLESWAQA